MLAWIVRTAITHRYLVIFCAVLLFVYGLFTLSRLPIDAVPDVTNNQVQINTVVEGLSPEQVEKRITYVIENHLKGIAGLESSRSLSRHGFSQVTAIFSDHINPYFARQQIGERLSEIHSILPEGAEPQMGPIATGLSEIVFWSLGFAADGPYRTPDGTLLHTEKEKLSYLLTLQQTVVKPRLLRISGLAGVDAIGGYVAQVQVSPQLDLLALHQISLAQLVDALSQSHGALGAGYIDQRGEAILVMSDAQLHALGEIEEIPLTASLRIKDVAKVHLGTEERFGSASQDGKEVVIGTALMRIGENSRTVAQAVEAQLAEIQMPQGIVLTPLLSRSTLVDSTIHTAVKNLVEGALLVIAVLFICLKNGVSACVTAIVIPIAMVWTTLGMRYWGISGNLMSLGALDFGLIVDGALIITENALRQLGVQKETLGRSLTVEERLHTVQQATVEMARPSVFGQAIILMVYVPLFALSGVEGKIFHPMAATVLFALIGALILSITFVPAALALLLREPKHHASINTQYYRQFLEKILYNPLRPIVVALLVVSGAGVVYWHLGQEFTPTLDEHNIAVQATRAPTTSLAQATAMQREVELKLRQFAEVEKVFSKTGTAELASDPMPADASDTFVILKPKEQWPNPQLTKEALIGAMEEELHALPGNSFEFTQPIEMRFNELIAGVKSDVAINIYGEDLTVLERYAHKVARLVRAIPGAADVAIDLPTGAMQINIEWDRLAAAHFGISIQELLTFVQTAFTGHRVATLQQGDFPLDVVVRLGDDDKAKMEQIAALLVPTPKGLVPLNQLATISLQARVGQVQREEGKRFVSVQANVRGWDLYHFMQLVQERIEQQMTLPPGYWIGFGGQWTQLIAAKERLAFVVPLCLVTIFALLCTALGSFKEALLVFTGVPLAIAGGIYALACMGLPFSISAAVGCIALSGIAVLNGLVLASTIQKGEGSIETAIVEGCCRRLRPVSMTALVASLGFLPMALATGAGAEVQKPIAVVVIGGLITSTLLTLVVLPALYKAIFAKRLSFRTVDLYE